MKICLLILSVFIIHLSSTNANELYIPDTNISNWVRINPDELNWNSEIIDSLFEFLDYKNTKSFIVLKDGKIVIEKYFGNFKQDSIWYWASAGKVITSSLIGIAEGEGKLSIMDESSKYLGSNWTSLTTEQENNIKIIHQLTMTTGLDDDVDDLFCTKPECLKFKAQAGTRWSYHNAPYTLLDKVLESASGRSFNQYFAEKIRNKIGMNGLWIKQDYNNVYFSNSLSVARFGILVQNDGKWKNNEIIIPQDYLKDMVNSSQELNKSYGYLWWLNGKDGFMLPGSQFVIEKLLFPDAPIDMIAALGKNGQILNISKELGLVVVRLGDNPGYALADITPVFNNDIWKYLNRIMDVNSGIQNNNDYNVYPNPIKDFVTVNGKAGDLITISDLLGRVFVSYMFDNDGLINLNLSSYSSGLYLMNHKSISGNKTIKLIKE
ncbi:serine hydrolase [Candidatus Kapaibacterium sp.]